MAKEKPTTKICKHCKSEIPYDAKVCPQCRKKQKEGDTRDAQEIAVEYNDKVIYPDKVRINRCYLHHYSFAKDWQMILCTVFGKKMEYAGEVI